jgi:short-subunit dehydrogenase
VNVLAPLAMAQLVIPAMRRQGGGTIVNIGSVAGLVSLPWAAGYSASKFAVDAVTDSLRRELRRDCIRVLQVCPGIVATAFRDHVLAGTAPPEVSRIRRVVSADHVASKIHRAVERRQSVLYVPRIGRLFALADAIAPWLMDWYLSRYSRDARDRKPELTENVSAGAAAMNENDS